MLSSRVGRPSHLKVSGSGFIAGSVVRWYGSPRATTFVSNSRFLNGDHLLARSKVIAIEAKKEEGMRTLRLICVVTISLLATFNLSGDVRRGSNNVVQQPTVSLSSTQLTWYYYPHCETGLSLETVTLGNKGPGVLDISSIAVTSSRFSQTNNCGSTLGVGHSCSITVRFHPIATLQPYNTYAKLLITDNGVASPQSVQLTQRWVCIK